MTTAPLDIEFSKYWVQLSMSQKQSLLNVIKSFFSDKEVCSIEDYNQELADGEAAYESGDFITQEEMLNLIRKW